MAAHRAEDREMATRTLEVVERGVDGPQDTEHVGLELATIVLDRQAIDAAHHAEARVRHDDVDASQGVPDLRRRPLQFPVPGDVAGEHERPSPAFHQLGGDRVETIGAAGGERDIGAATRELARERRADAGRGAGDECDATGEGQPASP